MGKDLNCGVEVDISRVYVTKEDQTVVLLTQYRFGLFPL